MTASANTRDGQTEWRPLWKQGRYWVAIGILVLVIFLTWYVAREICEPGPISYECFGWQDD